MDLSSISSSERARLLELEKELLDHKQQELSEVANQFQEHLEQMKACQRKASALNAQIQVHNDRIQQLRPSAN